MTISDPNAVAIILQARMGSSRLPGKVLADLCGRPLISFLIERLRRCELVDEIILATTSLSEDDVLMNWVVLWRLRLLEARSMMSCHVMRRLPYRLLRLLL